MNGRGPLERLGIAAALLVSLLSYGCALPLVPGYEEGSRENLSRSVPKFIVSGKTTREDVLLELGEADGKALDESWLSYGCAFGRGGVLFVMAAGGGAGGAGVEAVEHRRLVVYFDEQGVVERAQFDKKHCPKGIVAVGRWEESRPCIDPAGDDLPLIRQLWRAR